VQFSSLRRQRQRKQLFPLPLKQLSSRQKPSSSTHLPLMMQCCPQGASLLLQEQARHLHQGAHALAVAIVRPAFQFIDE